MKKSNSLEIIGVLSLSLLITATMSVSSTLPEMLDLFHDYSRSSVEMLFSIPAFSMVLIIALTPFLTSKLNERTLIVSGLLLYGFFGLIPLFSTSYPVIFISRILMGIGNGMVNIKAVSMIGQRFSGNLQLKLQGIRCSMETLGQAALTMIAGQLLYWGWNYAYLIYSAAFVILAIYLLFVPNVTEVVPDTTVPAQEKQRLTASDWTTIVKCNLLGALFISSSVCVSLRLTNLITDYGIGTATDGATILSIATFAGFVGGIFFGDLSKLFSKYMLPVSMVLTALGFFVIGNSHSLFMVAAGACICNFFITNCVSHLFGSLSVMLPLHCLDTANAAVLVGCNLGASAAPLALQLIGYINPSLTTGFYVYGLIYVIIACASFIQTTKKPH